MRQYSNADCTFVISANYLPRWLYIPYHFYNIVKVEVLEKVTSVRKICSVKRPFILNPTYCLWIM